MAGSWSRRTNVYLAVNMTGEPISIQDRYTPLGEDFLPEKISLERDANFGMAHLVGPSRDLNTEGKAPLQPPVSIIQEGAACFRSPFRLTGKSWSLLQAKNVNELLMAMYDTLEVLRASLSRQENSPNVRWGGKNVSPAVQNVLGLADGAGYLKDPALFKCLIIDHDDAARRDVVHAPPDFTRRTATPMYAARDVCLRGIQTFIGYRVALPMPELSDEAQALYVRVHGQPRYERYNDTKATQHGALPPSRESDIPCPPFRHRPEHDVESVYWSMVSTLLRVHPKDVDREAQAATNTVHMWERLLSSHKIPRSLDMRQCLVMQTDREWKSLFLGDMKDVGTLLYHIFEHVIPEYALWNDGLLPDHLHEAVQRLILQYLVDHKKPIELDPQHSRPVRAITPAKKVSGTMSDSLDEVNTRNSPGTTKMPLNSETIERKSADTDRDGAGSVSSSGTRVTVSEASPPFAIGPKRRNSCQGGRRPNLKRPRNDSDSASHPA